MRIRGIWVAGWVSLAVLAVQPRAEAFPITFDAQALSAPQFTIDFGAGVPNSPVSIIDLPAGTHSFSSPNSFAVFFSFDVTVSGTLDFAPALDSYVGGRGTSTLTVTGFPITVDATAMSSLYFNIDRGLASNQLLTAVVTTVRLLPAPYGEFNVPAGNPYTSFPFGVTTAGTLDLDPALDAYVSGRGTSTLTVTGFPITVDATGLAAALFSIDFSNVAVRSTCEPSAFRLLPAPYSLQAPHAGSAILPTVSFTVSTTGTLDYVCDSMLNTCDESCVAGRGTTLLRVTCGPRTQCGNAVVETCEQCDDGNTASGDCCAPSCQFDAPGASCPDEGNVCTDDRCNAFGTCLHPGNTAPCDDGLFCDGTDTCSGGFCMHTGDPCVGGAVCNDVCDELADDCVSPSGTSCPNDGNVCTRDVCNGTSPTCDHPPGNANTPCADDGNVCTRDVCDGSHSACQHPPGNAGITCRGIVGVCDLAETCDGLNAVCPPDTGKPDTDGDGTCDAAPDNCPADANTDQADGDFDGIGDVCDPCTNGAVATKPKLTATKLALPTGDDKLSIKGEAVVPSSPPIDPVGRGVRLLLTGATGTTLLDVAIPPGAYDALSKSGWNVNGALTAWTYKGPGTSTQGIQKVGVKLNSAVSGGIKFSAKGKNGAYALGDSDIPVTATLVLDVPTATEGQCVDIQFPASPPARPSCALNATGITLKCK